MVPAGLADVSPWRTWKAAAEGSLRFLAGYAGWDVWMVTQVVDDQQVVLLAHPPEAVPRGTALPWEGSFCRQMAAGNAPRLATVTAAVPVYSNLRTGPVRDIAAYVGVPLVRPDGSLFGSLCGIAYRARPRSAAGVLTVVEAAARLLSTLMAAGMEPPEPPPTIPPPERDGTDA